MLAASSASGARQSTGLETSREKNKREKLRNSTIEGYWLS